MNKNFRTVIIYLILLGVLVWVVMNYMGEPPGTPDELSTSNFRTAIQEGRVQEAILFARDGRVEGTYWTSEDDMEAEEPTAEFQSTFVGEDSFNELMATGESVNPGLEWDVNNEPPSPWIGVLTAVLPILLLVGIMLFFLSQMQGGNSKIMSFGKAKVKRMTRDQPRVTFKDVSGVDEAIEELHEIKEFLANPDRKSVV